MLGFLAVGLALAPVALRAPSASMAAEPAMLVPGARRNPARSAARIAMVVYPGILQVYRSYGHGTELHEGTGKEEWQGYTALARKGTVAPDRAP